VDTVTVAARAAVEAQADSAETLKEPRQAVVVGAEVVLREQQVVGLVPVEVQVQPPPTSHPQISRSAARVDGALRQNPLRRSQPAPTTEIRSLTNKRAAG